MIFNQPQDGITPHIGDNGNWFLGKNDTGVRANGQTNTELVPLTILSSDWDTETGEVVVSCAGISANEADQIVTLIPSVESKAACKEAAIECVAINNNSFTLKAETVPAEDIHIYAAMEVVGGAQDKEVYSLEEQVVGTWVDGKPLYRKTVIMSLTGLTANVGKVVGTFAEANVVDAITNYYGAAHVSDGGTIPLSFHLVTESTTFSLWFVPTTGEIKVKLGTYYASRTSIVRASIEYTKIADTATVAMPSMTDLAASYEQGVNEA